MIKKIKSFIKGIWNWYFNKFINDDHPSRNIPLDKLKWLPKNVYTGKPEPFGHIDSIQFDIKNILTKEEVVIEVASLEKAKEVVEKCVAQI